MSLAFSEFSGAQLSTRIHEALNKHGYAGEQVWHNSRDSTTIEARQKSVPKKQAATPVKKHTLERLNKGKAPRRLDKQLTMELVQMLDALPKDCN